MGWDGLDRFSAARAHSLIRISVLPACSPGAMSRRVKRVRPDAEVGGVDITTCPSSHMCQEMSSCSEYVTIGPGCRLTARDGMDGTRRRDHTT